MFNSITARELHAELERVKEELRAELRSEVRTINTSLEVLRTNDATCEVKHQQTRSETTRIADKVDTMLTKQTANDTTTKQTGEKVEEILKILTEHKLAVDTVKKNEGYFKRLGDGYTTKDTLQTWFKWVSIASAGIAGIFYIAHLVTQGVGGTG